MKDMYVVKIVNVIKSRAMNHKRFRNFLNEIDAEHGDVTYFTDVHQLCREKVLKTENFEFATSKQRFYK